MYNHYNARAHDMNVREPKLVYTGENMMDEFTAGSITSFSARGIIFHFFLSFRPESSTRTSAHFFKEKTPSFVHRGKKIHAAVQQLAQSFSTLSII
jgi:hypothetical protein